MTTERQNEAVVQRFYDELWNEWRLDVAEKILSETLRFRGSLGTVSEGREAFKAYAESVRAAFPDWHNRIDEILAVGDRVVTRMTWTGTPATLHFSFTALSYSTKCRIERLTVLCGPRRNSIYEPRAKG